MDDIDIFLQNCCDLMDDAGIVITPESLTAYQSRYDVGTCKAWLQANR